MICKYISSMFIRRFVHNFIQKTPVVNNLFTYRCLLPTNPNITYIHARESNIIVAKQTDNLETCVYKMFSHNIRHLLIVNDNNEYIGIMSVNDRITLDRNL